MTLVVVILLGLSGLLVISALEDSSLQQTASDILTNAPMDLSGTKGAAPVGGLADALGITGLISAIQSRFRIGG